MFSLVLCCAWLSSVDLNYHWNVDPFLIWAQRRVSNSIVSLNSWYYWSLLVYSFKIGKSSHTLDTPIRPACEHSSSQQQQRWSWHDSLHKRNMTDMETVSDISLTYRDLPFTNRNHQDNQLFYMETAQSLSVAIVIIADWESEIFRK